MRRLLFCIIFARRLLFCIIFAFAPQIAAAQDYSKIPEGHPGLLSSFPALPSDGNILFEDEKSQVFWPRSISDKSKPDCEKSAHITIVSKRLPSTRFTRAMLWEEFLPRIKQIISQNCTKKTAYPINTVVANFYFHNLFVRNGAIYLGRPTPSDKAYPFALATFRLDRKTLGNYSVDTFAPTIFGMDGNDRHGSWYAKFFQSVEINERTGKTTYAMLQEAYTNFPKYDYLDVLSYTLKIEEQSRVRREKEDEMIWKLFVIGMINRLGSGGPRCASAEDMYSCVEDVPIILID
ncbi:MAG: hypothetical protein GXP04_00660 [Alphaproteobacteria bacterium]|nr:hypothetical protein [Alphaproteobacteria bacterium]